MGSNPVSSLIPTGPDNTVITTGAPAGRMAGSGRSRIERLSRPEGVPRPAGPYSPAVAAGGFVFVSGQGPKDPATGRPVEGGIEEQTRQVIRNIRSVLKGAGLDLSDVVKANVFLRDIKSFEAFNRAYAEFFGAEPPSRTTVQASLPSPETLVEIEVVAKDRR